MPRRKSKSRSRSRSHSRPRSIKTCMKRAHSKCKKLISKRRKSKSRSRSRSKSRSKSPKRKSKSRSRSRGRGKFASYVRVHKTEIKKYMDSHGLAHKKGGMFIAAGKLYRGGKSKSKKRGSRRNKSKSRGRIANK